MDLINTCFESAHEVRALAYYSHLVPMMISLVIGFIVLLYARNRDKALMFSAFILTLCLWLSGNLITWASNDYNLVAAFWAPLDFLNVLFFLFIFYFSVFDFTLKHRIRLWALIVGTLASLPPLLVTIAGRSVYEFDEPNCEMIGSEWLALYKLGLEFSVVILIVVVGIVSLIKHKFERKEVKRILLTKLSTIGFLAIFAGSEYLSTSTGNYEINLYALFALPIFILLLAISIFEMRTFRFKMESIKVTHALFIVFMMVTISNMFISDETSEFIMSGIGAAITLGFGLIVLRGADRESEQRKQNERLTENLEKANSRLRALDKQKSEFVSVASHQLRSPLTSIRGYASLLLDGSYGEVPEKMHEPIKRIEQSSKLMAFAIEDFLNVSRIESGNMKYNFTDFNLRDEVEHVCDDLRRTAADKGLTLIFRADLNSRGLVHLDIGKVVQITQNLIHNSIKYTREGTVNVFIRDNIARKRIYIDIQDTGIGMSREGLQLIFQKFERAENANSIDIHGTGLGLFVSLKMSEAMGGTIKAYSEGVEKGSLFTIEFPLAL